MSVYRRRLCVRPKITSAMIVQKAPMARWWLGSPIRLNYKESLRSIGPGADENFSISFVRQSFDWKWCFVRDEAFPVANDSDTFRCLMFLFFFFALSFNWKSTVAKPPKTPKEEMLQGLRKNCRKSFENRNLWKKSHVTVVRREPTKSKSKRNHTQVCVYVCVRAHSTNIKYLILI